MSNNDHYPYRDWEQMHSPLTGKVHEQNIWQRYHWVIIAVISMLLVLLFASTTLYLLFKRPTNTPITFTSTPDSHKPQITLTPTSALSTATSTLSGTQTIPMNRTLICTSDCGPVHITITTAIINNNSDQFTLTLTIDPGTAQGNYYFGNLDIQDENGTTYQPQGQVRDSSRFNLVPHQPITLVATYPFIPQANTLYTLKTTLWSETLGTGEELFGDYQFKL